MGGSTRVTAGFSDGAGAGARLMLASGSTDTGVAVACARSVVGCSGKGAVDFTRGLPSLPSDRHWGSVAMSLQKRPESIMRAKLDATKLKLIITIHVAPVTTVPVAVARVCSMYPTAQFTKSQFAKFAASPDWHTSQPPPGSAPAGGWKLPIQNAVAPASAARRATCTFSSELCTHARAAFGPHRAAQTQCVDGSAVM